MPDWTSVTQDLEHVWKFPAQMSHLQQTVDELE